MVASVILLLALIAKASAQTAWINEFHYDNKGSDKGEFVEVAYTGTSLSGWQLAFYNGSNGSTYATVSLSGAFSSGVSFAFINRQGIQNGGPDGIALVDNNGAVVDLVSYEGSFTASSGVAAGLLFSNIGVSETSSTSRRHSLQLAGTGCQASDFTWQSPQTETKGGVNAGQTISCSAPPTSPPTPEPTSFPSAFPTPFPTPFPTNFPTTSLPTVSPVTIPSAGSYAWINEFHYDDSSADEGEFIEIAYTAGFDITSYTVVLYNGNVGSAYSTLPIPVGSDVGSGVSVSVIIDLPQNIQNGPDGIALIGDSNSVVEFISYEGSFVATNNAANGMTSTNIGVSENGSDPTGLSLQRTGTGCSSADFTWLSPQSETKGAINFGQTFNCGGAGSPTPAPIATGVVPTLSQTTNPIDTAMPTTNFGAGARIESVSAGVTVVLGDLPAGLADVYIEVDSTADVDIQLYDGTTKLVDRIGGIIDGSIRESTIWSGLRIEYSGHQGEQRTGTSGEEYIFLSGTIPVDLTVKLHGNSGSDGSVLVQYNWGYYENAYGQSGATLKSALHDIIDDHTEQSYTPGCWDALMRTDQDPLNPDNVLTLYSRRSTAKVDRDSGCSCPDFWNREHVWSQAHGNFGTTLGPGTDVHALRASDKSLNSERAAKDFAYGGGTLSANPGDCPTCLETDDTFEPPDAVKGSVARMIFYMATRYNGDTGSNGVTLDIVDYFPTPFGGGTSSTNGLFGKLGDLKTWNTLYPPTEEEYYRNNVIFQIQGNRNPFIDHPEWVDLIF